VSPRPDVGGRRASLLTWPPEPGVGSRKLADQVARRIEEDVVRAGWPIGALVGSESELLARYEVSRAVFREAVRLVEYLGIARMRRGPGGGLVVTEPDPSGVITAVVVYLTYVQVRLEDVLQARRPIEVAAARLAAERVTPVEVEELRGQVDAERDGRADHRVVHATIAHMTRNPALELFVEILGRVTAQYQATPRLTAARARAQRAEAATAHASIVKALGAGDGVAAARRMGRHLDAVESFLVSRQLDRTLTFVGDGSDGRGKRGALVAREILSDVVARGWTVGEMLGSESDLMRAHAVSRAVLREAIRLLEFHGVVRTRRGPGGGVFVAAPDVVATTEAMAVYLESRRISPEMLFEVRQAMELVTVELAVQSRDDGAVEVLQNALRDEAQAPVEQFAPLSHALHLRIAEVTGNGAVVLFLHVLTRLTEQYSRRAQAASELSPEEAAARVRRAHSAIVAAIVARDRDRALRRMQRHLEAITPLMR
jgi:DNA-binding FadR family transcriptional regulator